MSGAATALLLAAAIASTGKPLCYPPAEVETMLVAGAPAVIRAVAMHCAVSLPRTSALVRDPGAVARGFAPAADAAWPQLAADLSRREGQTMSVAQIRPATERGLSQQLAGEMSPETCGKFDRVLAAAAGLPPRGLIHLFIAIAEIGNDDEEAVVGGFTMCRGEGR